MNKHSALRTSGSLLERAAELYGFDVPVAANRPTPAITPVPDAVPERSPEPVRDNPRPDPRRAAPSGAVGKVDRERLREGGFIVPEDAAGALAEEFRIVKRQLLLGAAKSSQVILVCSAQPDEGKTFCAVNLALSLAGERDMDSGAAFLDAMLDATPHEIPHGDALCAALEHHALDASLLKIAGSESLDAIVDDLVQIHGGNGFVRDYPAERRYRDARPNRSESGSRRWKRSPSST